MATLEQVLGRFLPDTTAAALRQSRVLEPVTADQEKRRIILKLAPPSLVSRKELKKVEQHLKEQFRLSLCSLLPRYEPEQFDRSYMQDIFEAVREKGYPVNGFFNECEILCDGDKLMISLKHGGAHFLENSGCVDAIRQQITEEFKRSFQISLDASEAAKAEEHQEKGLQEFVKSLPKAEEKPKKEKKIEEKCLSFDCHDLPFIENTAIQIMGKEIKERPISLKDVTQESGRVTVWGDITRKESISSRDKKWEIYSIDITDYESSTTLKIITASDKKEAIVKHLANEISLETGYEVYSKETENSAITTLEKKGAQADTTIKVISLIGKDDYGQTVHENYILMEIILKGSAGSTAYTYKDTLDTLYKDLGMTPTTNIYMCSQTKGELTESEMENIVSSFLESVDANEIERLTLDNTLCIYGYSKNIDEYVYQNDKKINVNIAFTYDSAEDITYIHRGIPFIDKSF